MELFSDQKINLKIESFFTSPRYGFKNECQMLNLQIEHSFKKKKRIEIITKIYSKDKK